MTFSVVFAYVADITSEEDRSSAYGLVSFHLLVVFRTVVICCEHMGISFLPCIFIWLKNEEADFPCNDSLRIALPHVVVILLADFSFMVVMPCNPISCPVMGCLVNNIMIMVGQSKKNFKQCCLNPPSNSSMAPE